MTAFFACGVCVDTSLFSVFPFAFYWVMVFVLWSLFIGVPLGVAAKWKKEPIPVSPWRYFLLGLGLFLTLGCLMLMGSVAVPLFLATGVSLYQVADSQWKYRNVSPPPEGAVTRMAYRIQKLYLTICVVLIPVAYLRLMLQKHGVLPTWSN